MAPFGHVITAIVTPFTDDGAVDYDTFSRLCTHLVGHGSDGLVVAGTTGESPTLSDDEKLALFKAAIDAVGGRATIIAGTQPIHSKFATDKPNRCAAPPTPMMSVPPISLATSDMPIAHHGSERPARKKSRPVFNFQPIASPSASVPPR